jgi:branched-subunit amino acid transport protein AzlD
MAAVAAPATSAAVIVAVNCAALTKVVARLAPFHCTGDAATKPAPFTVSVKAADPAAIEEGDRLVTLACGLSTSNDTAADVPPPGPGLTTVTAAKAAAARSLAPMAAVNCVALTNVVARFAPFHFSCEAATKPLPVTVNANAPPPAAAVAGKMDAIAGAGLAVIVKLRDPDVPPPGAGLTTVTGAEPGTVRSLAGITAVSCVELTNVVTRAVPFHITEEAATNPLPPAVSVNPLEFTGAEAG